MKDSTVDRNPDNFVKLKHLIYFSAIETSLMALYFKFSFFPLIPLIPVQKQKKNKKKIDAK